MDFELSDEQRLLRDTMRSFVDEQIRPVAREWEESGRYPEEIVATMRPALSAAIRCPAG